MVEEVAFRSIRSIEAFFEGGVEETLGDPGGDPLSILRAAAFELGWGGEDGSKKGLGGSIILVT